MGLLDVDTDAGEGRLIGDLVIEATLDDQTQTVVGYENHGGRTSLGPAASPLGRVVKGHGNDGVSGFEGRRQWLIARQDLVITVNDTSTECGSPCVTLRIEYPYGNDVRLLPNIGVPGLGMLSFIPDRLVAKAVVAR